jgi:hypothetical protein
MSRLGLLAVVGLIGLALAGPLRAQDPPGQDPEAERLKAGCSPISCWARFSTVKVPAPGRIDVLFKVHAWQGEKFRGGPGTPTDGDMMVILDVFSDKMPVKGPPITSVASAPFHIMEKGKLRSKDLSLGADLDPGQSYNVRVKLVGTKPISVRRRGRDGELKPPVEEEHVMHMSTFRHTDK